MASLSSVSSSSLSSVSSVGMYVYTQTCINIHSFRGGSLGSVKWLFNYGKTVDYLR